MFDFLRFQYNIDYNSLLKLSDKTYKILTDNRYYLIKEVDDFSLDSVYRRLLISKVNFILFPLRGKNENYVQLDDDKKYVILPFYEDEKISANDLKCDLFIKFLGDLHLKTAIEIDINNSFLETTLNYLDESIKKISDKINARMEVIERSDYHSPNDWYFLMHFNILNSSLEKASKHVLNFENDVKDAKSLRLSLTYQNFDFNHILLKDEKIISLEKINYNISSYDLYDFISKVSTYNISINNLIKAYLNINPLNEYEKEYLLAVLYIFNYVRYENMLDDLSFLIDLVNYIEKIDRLEEEIIFSSEDSE